MSLISVDIETNGPVTGYHSMIELGAVVVDEKLDKTFHILIRPLFQNYHQPTLDAMKWTRESILARPNQENIQSGMQKFLDWLAEVSGEGHRPYFIGDNPGFDFAFITHGFFLIGVPNPFGHSSLSIGSLYKGMNFNVKANFKRLRKTKHSHNALEDAVGNAEAILAFGPSIKGLL